MGNEVIYYFYLIDFTANFSHQLDEVMGNLVDVLNNITADNILLNAIESLFI